MSDPEPDAIFRERLMRVVAEKDRNFALVAAGAYLDQLACKYDRFRTGVPLKTHAGDDRHLVPKPTGALWRSC